MDDTGGLTPMRFAASTQLLDKDLSSILDIADFKMKEPLSDLLHEYQDLFPQRVADMPGIKCPPFRIELEEGARPAAIKQRRWSRLERDSIRIELDVMLEAKIIEPSTSP